MEPPIQPAGLLLKQVAHVVPQGEDREGILATKV